MNWGSVALGPPMQNLWRSEHANAGHSLLIKAVIKQDSCRQHEVYCHIGDYCCTITMQNKTVQHLSQTLTRRHQSARPRAPVSDDACRGASRRQTAATPPSPIAANRSPHSLKRTCATSTACLCRYSPAIQGRRRAACNCRGQHARLRNQGGRHKF